MSSSDELIKKRINLSKEIVKNICRYDDLTEQQKTEIDAWFNSLPSNSKCNIEINSDLNIKLEFYQDMHVEELITIYLTKNQTIPNDKFRSSKYIIINGILNEIRQITKDRKEKIRDEVSFETFRNRNYSDEEIVLLNDLVPYEIRTFLHSSGYYRSITRYSDEWNGYSSYGEIDEQITSFDKNEDGIISYTYSYEEKQEESSDTKYFIELNIKDGKAEINADIYIQPYDAQVTSARKRRVIKMLPDKVLNEIKRQVKVAGKHDIDISDIPEEFQPPKERETVITADIQGTGETPGGDGNPGYEDRE